MRKWKKIIAAIIIMILAGAGYGWFLYNKKPADTRQQAALAEISAIELVKAYQKDEAAANRQYVDRLIIVSGKVSGTQVDAEGHATVFIDTGDPLAAVTCSFYNDEVEAVKKIAAGSPVRIKGMCTGMLTDVVLNKCSLVK